MSYHRFAGVAHRGKGLGDPPAARVLGDLDYDAAGVLGISTADFRQFFLAYRSLCPSAWVERWDEQRDNGKFPVDLER